MCNLVNYCVQVNPETKKNALDDRSGEWAGLGTFDSGANLTYDYLGNIMP